MKHWIEFTHNKSHRAKRLGKLVNALDFEILEAERNLAMYQAQKQCTEAEILQELAKYYPTPEALENEVQEAKNKAEQFNTEPVKYHIPKKIDFKTFFLCGVCFVLTPQRKSKIKAFKHYLNSKINERHGKNYPIG